MNAMTNLPLHARRVVSIRPISSEGWAAMSGDRRATHSSAAANYHYITRTSGTDTRGALDFRHRDDLVAHGIELPANHPKWAAEEGRIWRELDAATAQLAGDAVRAWHVVVSLPTDREQDDWIEMVRAYADATAAVGPAVAWAVHAKEDGEGGWAIPPHAHLLVTTRVWRHDARHGLPVASWSGPAMRSQLHKGWLARLPQAMRLAASSPYSVGGYTPAQPDCSALRLLFDTDQPVGRTDAARIRRRPRARTCPRSTDDGGGNQPNATRP